LSASCTKAPQVTVDPAQLLDSRFASRTIEDVSSNDLWATLKARREALPERALLP